MPAPGETDLKVMLATLRVERRPGVFVYVAMRQPPSELLEACHAMVMEGEMSSLVLPLDDANRAGLSGGLEMAWLSLTVQSSLEAVGLTAAVATTLSEEGIPCNVLAGYLHDHILVPVDRAGAAIQALTSRQT